MARAMEVAKEPRRDEARFEAYPDEIAAVLGHASRAAAARAYCTGLLLPGARKSVEPMAARIEPGRVQADRKSTRLNSSHANISYAVFCLKKKKNSAYR